MNDTPNATDGIANEIETVMPGEKPLTNLTLHKTGPVSYTVLSARNGSVTAHRVNVATVECTCEDMAWNVSDADSRDVCAHLAKALLAGPANPDGGEMAVGQLYHVMGRMDDVTEELETEAEMLQDHATEAGAARRSEEAADRPAGEGEAVAGDDDATDDDAPSASAHGPQNESSGPDVDEAADKLQTAFDDVIDDMQVQANAGVVYFQTGRDTPDDWPFPGGGETFHVVTDPDMVEYVHDGTADWANGPHEWYEDKPGEWWKNAIDPVDVDDYIDEVLG